MFDIIEAIKYLILGIIQGITEVIPISSSGHVEFFQAFFHLKKDEGLLFLVLVNTGSLLTFVIIYFKKIIELIKDFFTYIFNKETRETTYKNYLLSLQIIVATIPIGIAGFVLKDFLDDFVLKQYGMLFVGTGFLLSGTVLFSIRDIRVKKGKTMINWSDTIFIGLAQAIAIFPGVSRSGMTSSTSIKRGMGIDSALNFSFLLYIPVSFAAIGWDLKNIATDGIELVNNSYIIYYILAFFGAAVATYFAYRLIFNIFKSGKLKYFSYYLIIIGLLSIFWFIAR